MFGGIFMTDHFEFQYINYLLLHPMLYMVAYIFVWRSLCVLQPQCHLSRHALRLVSKAVTTGTTPSGPSKFTSYR